VLARLRGLLRRADLTRRHGENELAVADLTMDEDAREVRRGGDLIDLTATEFELLRFLMRNPRRVLSKAQILDRVWNYDFGGQALPPSGLAWRLAAGPCRWLARRTLRGRLIAGLLALLALACAVVGGATYLAVNRFLLIQLDDQLQASARLYAAACQHHDSDP